LELSRELTANAASFQMSDVLLFFVGVQRFQREANSQFFEFSGTGVMNEVGVER